AQAVARVAYRWDGDQLSGQTQYRADGSVARAVQWVYEPGSFRPLAQVEEKGGRTQLHYIVTDLTGTARELCSEAGEVHWRGEQGLWGVHREDRRPIPLRRWLGDAANEEVYCELRYQGQVYDSETGLYYNRHRYYDPETAQYLSSDPIGLGGGIRPQAYVHNPLEWVDPLGLVGCPGKFKSRNEAFRAAKRDAGIPMSQQPSKVELVPLTDRNGKGILGDNHLPIKTREYTFERPNGESIVIQDHSPGHIYGPPGTPGNQGPHMNVRPISDTRNGNVAGTLDHYSF
ncbi:HNH/endonuclease VII fold putative polymorphic toxin, partial [Dickeya chrysanthemi]|uniref:HNH/endonuclease VII fold putative polymorphic toxin n=1 Tax=Dickeya chrysanthemi TaxID=556 RepID=UPI003018C357